MNQTIQSCESCGQEITNIVMINGKSYGTTCALYVLGIKELPLWFNGGDWDEAKAKHEANLENNAKQFEEARAITSEFWSEWHTLSIIKQEAYNKHNDWLHDFMYSVMLQLGYTRSIPYMPTTLEEAENDPYHKYMIVYLNKRPKRISELSPKQLAIVNKYL
jgi:hypothetical protein